MGYTYIILDLDKLEIIKKDKKARQFNLRCEAEIYCLERKGNFKVIEI